MLAWTACEVVVLVICLPLFGPAGLAVSYAISVWLGLSTIVWRLGGARTRRFVEVVRVLVVRPGMVLPVAVSALLLFVQPWFVAGWIGHAAAALAAAAVVLVSYLAEPDIRGTAARTMGRLLGRGRPADAAEPGRIGTL
jgi:hypothetical protein